MANLKNFFNEVLNGDRIYTREDIGSMSSKEFQKHEKAIDYQLSKLGVPTNADMAASDDVVYVKAYTRDDGTKVKAHYRSKHGHLLAQGNEKHVLPAEKETSAAASDVKEVKSANDNNIKFNKADFSQYDWNPFVKINNNENRNNPDAREFANISLVKPENAPKSSEYQIVQKGFEQSMNHYYKLSGTNKEIPKGLEGVIYNNKSSISYNVSNSGQFQKQVKSQYDSKNKRFKTDKLEVNFTDDQNLHLSLGHCTVLNPKVDSQGYFTGTIFDIYDFDSAYKDKSKNDLFISGVATGFAGFQKVGIASKYYTLVPVRFKF